MWGTAQHTKVTPFSSQTAETPVSLKRAASSTQHLTRYPSSCKVTSKQESLIKSNMTTISVHKRRQGGCCAKATTPVDVVSTQGPVIVWFKNDLRISDHPGLALASELDTDVVPVYCLDPELLRDSLNVPGGVELLWGAIRNLKTCLQSIGSDLVIRVGPVDAAIKDISQSVGASKIVTEKEIDHRWQDAIDTVKKLGVAPVSTWSTSIWDEVDYSKNFGEFNEVRGKPLPVPGTVQSLNSIAHDLRSDPIPEMLELKLMLEAVRAPLSDGSSVDPFGKNLASPWVEWAAHLTATAESALELLREYLDLQQVDGNDASPTLKHLVQEIEEESLPGLSFPALFFPVLSLGILSPRQIYAEATKSVAESGSVWSNMLGVLGSNFTSKAAITEVESVDFHSSLALCQLESALGSHGSESVEKRFWNWQGLVVEFTVSKPDDCQEDAPAVLLIHGFGASSFHWRRNVENLREAGNVVYCLTLPGFGQTQKPSLKYSQFVWRQCIHDFIVGVIGRRVVVAGNSIGGYSAASVAGFHKSLISGVVLLNSAGPITPGFTAANAKSFGNPEKSPPPRLVVDLVANVLLYYLEKTAGGTLKKLYPVNPDNADEDLAADVLRAGRDPNAVSVLKSVFFLKTPMPLNYLISEKYGGPVLVLQGRKDPLNDAKSRADLLASVCSNVKVKVLEAGHCPHDEAPKEVNSEIVEFVQSLKESDSQLGLVEASA